MNPERSCFRISSSAAAIFATAIFDLPLSSLSHGRDLNIRSCRPNLISRPMNYSTLSNDDCYTMCVKVVREVSTREFQRPINIQARLISERADAIFLYKRARARIARHFSLVHALGRSSRHTFAQPYTRALPDEAYLLARARISPFIPRDDISEGEIEPSIRHTPRSRAFIIESRTVPV